MDEDLTGGGLNPMTWFLNLFAAANPDKAGPLLDSMGVPPPNKLGVGAGMAGPGLASLMQPAPDMSTQPSPTGVVQTGGTVMSDPTPASWANPTVTTTSPEGVKQNDLMKTLGGLQGMKAPEAIKPIMSGGVTGGVKPPEVQLGGAAKAGAPAIQAMMAALLGGSPNPLRVPSLGDFLRGGKY